MSDAELKQLKMEFYNILQPNNLTLEDILNLNDTDDVLDMFYFYRTEQLAFLWLLFVFIVLGNGSVLAAIRLSDTGNRTRMNYFIMHLAIADLSVGLVNVMTDIIWKTALEWYGGNVVCKLVRYMQAVVTYASTYVLVALSIDRFDAVAWPMNFSGRVMLYHLMKLENEFMVSMRMDWNVSGARMLIGIAWVLSLIFSTPMLYANQVKVHQNGNMQCWMEFPEHWHWQLYISLIAAAIFIIPAIIIAACYSIIVYVIWTKSGGVGNHNTNIDTSSPTGNNHLLDGSSIRPLQPTRLVGKSSSRGVIPQAKIRTVKMTLIIVLVFILCWSPYFVFDLLDAYDQIPISQSKIAVSTFIQSLAPLNCAANPIIYGIFSTRICRNLRRVKLRMTSWPGRCCVRDHRHKVRRRFSSGPGSWTDHTANQSSARSSGPSTRSNGTSTRSTVLPLAQRNVSPRDGKLLAKNISHMRTGQSIQSSALESETDAGVSVRFM